MSEEQAAPHEELIAAATVLLLRDEGHGIEVLMLRRNSKIAFGGMWVFPGGRVDPEERSDDELESARQAAARETHEEAGLVVAAADLVTWSHWQPPAAKHMSGAPGPLRRFSTWFFAADAPGGEVAIDHGEIHEHEWLRPQAAMEKHHAGDIELVPPTWLTLHQLAQHETVDAALHSARLSNPPRFWTRPLKGDVRALVWHGDAAYETGDAASPGGRNRLLLDPGGWTYIKS